MRVYRIEYPDSHRGPYNPGLEAEYERISLSDDLIMAHAGDPSRPTPREYVPPDQIFAFASKGALRAWFDGWLTNIDYAGAQIATYKIPADAVSYRDKYQLTFNPEKSTSREYADAV